MSSVDKAIELAQKAYAGRKGENGEAMILHSLAVGLSGSTDEERTAGFLHDILIEGGLSEDELLAEGIDQAIVNAVAIATPAIGISAKTHAMQLALVMNPIAIKVRINDLKQHLAEMSQDDASRPDYEDALVILQKELTVNSIVTLYDDSVAKAEGLDIAIFAAGCFWGVQHYFERQKGVKRTLVGYTGGKEDNPTYEDVREHKTTHLEAVLVEYNPKEISFCDLAKLFFEIHDPAQTDGQGPDLGPQYLSGVFYRNEAQQAETMRLVGILRDNGYEVNSRIEPLGKFWIAEGYHQNYYDHTGGSPYCHIRQRKF